MSKPNRPKGGRPPGKAASRGALPTGHSAPPTHQVPASRRHRGGRAQHQATGQIPGRTRPPLPAYTGGKDETPTRRAGI